MPSHYAHWYFGSLVQKALPAPLAELVRSWPEPFLAGLQGPDVLFHYHPLRPNPVKREGSAIHSRSGLCFLTQARDILLQKNTSAGRSYLAGFLCHYMLDTACHPLVEKGMAASGASHSSVETDLDRVLMARDGVDPYDKTSMDLLPASRPLAETMAPFYPPVTAAQMETALRGMRRDIRLTRVRSGAARAVIFRALRMTGTYEGYHGIFFDPRPLSGCEESTRRLVEKLEAAVEETAGEIERFFTAVDQGESLSQRLKWNFGGTL